MDRCVLWLYDNPNTGKTTLAQMLNVNVFKLDLFAKKIMGTTGLPFQLHKNVQHFYERIVATKKEKIFISKLFSKGGLSLELPYIVIEGFVIKSLARDIFLEFKRHKYRIWFIKRQHTW